jgi:DNA-binding LacI/PurR family transcriptional regulator
VADPSDLLLVTIASAVAAALAERSIRSFVTWDPGGGPGIHAPDSRAVSGWVRVGARPTPTQNFATAIPDIGIADSPDDRRDIIDLGRIYGLALACRYLATQGHHRIAVLAAPDMFEADRFVAALGEASVALEPVGVGLPGVRTALKQMGQGHWRPTAVLCDSDVAALAAVQGCAAEGMAVPRQVSIVGFGDVPFARYSVPTLTTIRVCVERIGALAAKAMMDRDSLRNAPLSPPAKLVVRQSSGPAP